MLHIANSVRIYSTPRSYVILPLQIKNIFYKNCKIQNIWMKRIHDREQWFVAKGVANVRRLNGQIDLALDGAWLSRKICS